MQASSAGWSPYLNGSPLARAYRDVKAGSFTHPLGANRAYNYLGEVAQGIQFDGGRSGATRLRRVASFALG